jgi:hypothetical protein
MYGLSFTETILLKRYDEREILFTEGKTSDLVPIVLQLVTVFEM